MPNEEVDYERTLFDCSNEIEKYKCEKCRNFQTHLSTSLKDHKSARSGSDEDGLKRHFVTGSKCLMTQHSFFHECTTRSDHGGQVQFACHRDDDLEFDSRLKDKRKISFRKESEDGRRSASAQYSNSVSIGTAKYHTCQRCPYKTTLTFRMNIHRMTHKLPKTYRLFNCANTIEFVRCFQCSNFRTYGLVDLKQHLKAGHTLPEKSDEKLYECESCHFQSHSNFLFLRHQLYNLCMIDWNRDPIPEESLRSSLPEINKNQIESDIGDELKFKCDRCQFETEFGPNLQVHISIKHTNPKKLEWFGCEHCSYKSARRFDLKKHMDDQHVNWARFKCDHCPFQTNVRQRLKDHILWKHTDPDQVRWFECDHCSHKAKRRCGLRRHLANMHGDRAKLKCDYCQFETKFAYSLKDHILARHTDPADIDMFSCELCSYRGKTKSRLKRHVAYKHVEKETIGCGRCPFETKNKQTLKRHVSVKHADPDEKRWFECEQCSYKDVVEANLKKHMDYKHGDRTKL